MMDGGNFVAMHALRFAVFHVFYGGLAWGENVSNQLQARGLYFIRRIPADEVFANEGLVSANKH